MLASQSKPFACLAPMDGYTDIAFRQVVRELNPEVILYSEFTNVCGIEHSEKVKKRLDFKTEEKPYIVQLFGNKPEQFAKIAAELEDSGIDGIDINMGCPSKRVVRHHSGASLMKNPDLACQIVESCVKATSLPVSVKTRLGWTSDEGLVDFVKGLESAGAKMVTVHGRTYSQAFRGEAAYDAVHRLKAKIKIPVILNGDIRSRDHAEEVLGDLDGYMIGRAAIGNPWAFWDQQRRENLSMKEKVETMVHHFQLIRSYKGESRALVEFRKHIGGYINGFHHAKAFRTRLIQSKDEKDFTQTALSLV